MSTRRSRLLHAPYYLVKSDLFCGFNRKQVNLADNPTLMRLRELEVLEKIAPTGNLNVVLGEKGLADRVINLLEPRSPWFEPSNQGRFQLLFFAERVQRLLSTFDACGNRLPSAPPSTTTVERLCPFLPHSRGGCCSGVFG